MKRSKQVNFRLTLREKLLLIKRAEKLGFNDVSTYVRFAVLWALEQMKKGD